MNTLSTYNEEVIILENFKFHLEQADIHLLKISLTFSLFIIFIHL